MQNLNVELKTLKGDTLTVLTGKALEQREPSKINLDGDIKTVGSFLSVRKQEGTGHQAIDKSKAVLLTDKKAMKIVLHLDPENYYGATITGQLEKSDELTPFYINQNKTFTKEELVKLIKFNKLYFEDAEKHREMLLAFQKISSTVNMRANDSSDERGNKERNFVKEVTTNAPTEFILNIPIFKGYPAKKFRVEVCLDVTEGSARFWFESVELHEIITKSIDEIFTEEIKAAEGFVIINQ